MSVTFQEWLAGGIGFALGAFFCWMLWPFAYTWRQHRTELKEPPPPAVDD